MDFTTYSLPTRLIGKINIAKSRYMQREPERTKKPRKPKKAHPTPPISKNNDRPLPPSFYTCIVVVMMTFTSNRKAGDVRGPAISTTFVMVTLT